MIDFKWDEWCEGVIYRIPFSLGLSLTVPGSRDGSADQHDEICFIDSQSDFDPVPSRFHSTQQSISFVHTTMRSIN